MVIRCGEPIDIFLHQVIWWIGPSWEMFGRSRSLQRYLSWCGASFATEFLQRYLSVLFHYLTRRVQLGASYLSRLYICLSFAMSLVSFGIKVLNWLGMYFVHSGELRHHFIQFTKMGGMPRSSHLFFKVIWFATIWAIWKERNKHVFQNTVSTPYSLLEKVKANSFLWLKSNQVAFNYSYHDWWNHPFFIWVFFCNLFCFWTAALLVAQ